MWNESTIGRMGGGGGGGGGGDDVICRDNQL